MHGLLLLVRGAGVYRDGDGRRQAVRGGDLFLLFPGLRHDYGPDPGGLWEESFIDIDGDLPRMWERQGILDRRRPILSPPAEAVLPLRHLIAAIDDGSLADPHEAQWRLYGALLMIMRARPAGDDALEAGRRLLAADPERPLDPRRAAQAAGLGWELFRKRFRERYGVPPARYRLQQRCEAAAQRLLAEDATVDAVAERAGFCDGAHLRRHFRSVMGFSPEAFRRLHGHAGG
jgi:AraC-like DNA-binding protein